MVLRSSSELFLLYMDYEITKEFLFKFKETFLWSLGVYTLLQSFSYDCSMLRKSALIKVAYAVTYLLVNRSLRHLKI